MNHLVRFHLFQELVNEFQKVNYLLHCPFPLLVFIQKILSKEREEEKEERERERRKRRRERRKRKRKKKEKKRKKILLGFGLNLRRQNSGHTL